MNPNPYRYTPLTRTPPSISRPAPEALPGDTLHVSIGRNVNGTPMPALQWDLFRFSTRQSVARHTGHGDNWRAVAEFAGVGFYGAMPEPSMIYAAVEAPAPNLAQLRRALAELAYDYGQDSIAVNISRSILVEYTEW